MGNMVKDPEIKDFESGSKLAEFSIGVTESFKNKNKEDVNRTEWIRLKCWGRLAEIAEEYLKKGMLIWVECKFVTDSWDDKDGNKKYSSHFNVSSLQMLDKKSNG